MRGWPLYFHCILSRQRQEKTQVVYVSMEFFPGKNTGEACHSLLQGNLPDPRIEPESPSLQADSSPSEPPSKPSKDR